MDILDGFRLGQVQKVVIALEMALAGAEAMAAKIVLRQAEQLDLGAHGAVENENALGCRLAQRLLRLGRIAAFGEGSEKLICR